MSQNPSQNEAEIRESHDSDELEPRKAAILFAVVGEYIRSPQPVGSSAIARTSGLGVSAATIRHEMNALERDGYLVQPHTSAGRIPTDRGYRGFVDALGAVPTLDAADSRRVGDFFADVHLEIDSMLVEASRLLSGLTHHASVLIPPGAEGVVVRSAQIVDMGSSSLLAVAVLSTGAVEKCLIDLPPEGSPDDVSAASALLNSWLVGSTLATAEATASLGQGSRFAHLLASQALLGLKRRADAESSQNAVVGGTSQITHSFDAVSSVEKVLGLLDQSFLVVGLIRRLLGDGQMVSIGSETGLDQLSDCSVVIAPLADEAGGGSVAVIGPTRMHYSRVLAAVSEVSDQLSRKIVETNQNA